MMEERINEIELIDNKVKIITSNNCITISLSQYIENQFCINQLVDINYLDDLASKFNEEEIEKYALNLLSKNEYYSITLYNKLYKKYKNKDIINKIINKLKVKHLLDDNEYIYNYINSKLSKGYGLLKIRQNLIDKNINEKDIDKFITNDIYEVEESMCFKLVSKYIEMKIDDYKNKIINKLIYKGYSEQSITAVLSYFKIII